MTAILRLIQSVLAEAVGGVVVASAVLALWAYRREQLRRFGDAFVRVSRRRGAWILLAALLGPGLRLALLPWFPLIDPVISDEFVHLLVADTLLEGRLSNPQHPFAAHFETAHVLSYPAYAAKYPIGQGAFLAFGKLLSGSYWFGVWLGMVLCCGAVAWCLYRWLPAPAAAFGGLLFRLRFGLDTYRIHTLWGGGAAAAGGALALAALPALLRTGSSVAAAVAITGWGIAWLIRPWESLPIGFVIAAAVLWRAWKRHGSPLGTRLGRSIGILAAGAVVLAGIVGFHNYSVTGLDFEFPYVEYQNHYGADLGIGFGWYAGEGSLPPAPQRERYHSHAPEDPTTYGELALRFADDYGRVWMFYLGVPLGLAFGVGVWYARKRRRYWLPLLMLGLGWLWTLAYPEARPHYVAPYAAAMILIAMFGLWKMRRWAVRGVPVGLLVAAACVCASVEPAVTLQSTRRALRGGADRTPRGEAVRRLERAGGKHLVFVRYTKNIRRYYEWIYNKADIDAAQIVWAFDLREENKRLMEYYPDRKVWLVEPDVSPELRPIREPVTTMD